MILPFNASLAISAARHLLKLGSRLDQLAAERTAVQSDLILRLPAFTVVRLPDCIDLAEAELRRTRGLDPDPFGLDRTALEAEIATARQGNQPGANFGPLFAKYFPDTSLLVDPDRAYLDKLRDAFPGVDWNDSGARIAAFAIGAGSTAGEIGYNARLALAVADTLLEFGADHAAEFVRDEKLRGLATTVLQRLAEPDWSSFHRWGPLVQTALSAALNAALDTTAQHRPDNPWLDGGLQALVDARSAAPSPDDYLLGLVRGDGFRLLLSRGLLVASDRLDDDGAPAFRLIAADLLKTAAPLVQAPGAGGFRQFFHDHWGDLLRAGLTSIDRHGDAILQGADPLLAKILRSLVQQLAQVPNAKFLTSGTLYHLADTAIGIVADNVATQPGLQDKPWLRDFLTATAASARALTTRHLFTKEAAERLLLDALGALAKHPDLLIAKPGLARDLVTAVLGGLATLTKPDARTLGETALRSALDALARDPGLAARPFGPALGAVASTLSGLVGQRRLTTADAADLAHTAVEATLRNPALFARATDDVASTILRALEAALPAAPSRAWAGRLFPTLARSLLLVFARSGRTIVEGRTAAVLQQWLTTVLDAGLQRAQARLGDGVDIDGVPELLATLTERALRGELTVFDPDNAEFKKLFDQLAAALDLQPATP